MKVCVSKNLFENAFKTRIKCFKRVASCKRWARVKCLEVYINKILFEFIHCNNFSELALESF